MARCYKPSNPAYAGYGGRGIIVCNRWHDIANFIKDNELLAKPGLSLDRIDNDGIYEPSNVKWSTPVQQALNRRSTILLTYNGKTKPLFEWARDFGINPKTLWARINTLKWSIERALTVPIRR